MNELMVYCQRPLNDPDTRQARVFRAYIIQSLLGMRTGESLWNDTRAIYFERDI